MGDGARVSSSYGWGIPTMVLKKKDVRENSAVETDGYFTHGILQAIKT
jgi:hypothetical protein